MLMVVLLALLSGQAKAQEASPTPGTPQGTIYVYMVVASETPHISTQLRSQDLDLSDYTDSGSVGKAMQAHFRDQFVDSYGGRVKFSWLLLTNPVYLESPQKDESIIFKSMARFKGAMDVAGDTIGWHYHHTAWGPVPTDTTRFKWLQVRTFNGTRYSGQTDRHIAEEMIARMILRDDYYPSTFQAGYGWENTDYSNWLDTLVPFDFTNLAPLAHFEPPGDLYDWSKAPVDWTYYHPDSADYQRPGNCNRYLFQCFPGYRSSDINVHEAFQRARKGGDALVGFYAHSFNDLAQFCRVVDNALKSMTEIFTNVKFRYVTAQEGVRALLKLEDRESPRTKVTLKGTIATFTSNEPLFGVPFGAVKTSAGEYRRCIPMTPQCVKVGVGYEWKFDLAGTKVADFAVGCCDPSGNWTVVHSKK